MAEEDLDEEGEAGGGGGDEGEGAPAKSGSKKKLFIIIVLAVLVVVGGVAAAYFTGLMAPLIAMLGGKPADKGAKVAAGEAVFLDLPELLVNLNTGGRKATFLKMRVALELEKKEQVPAVEKMMPRIVDNFQVYLRELRIEDLKGSAGMYRLKEELMARVSAAIAPAKVNDVLFKEMLVQ